MMLPLVEFRLLSASAGFADYATGRFIAFQPATLAQTEYMM